MVLDPVRDGFYYYIYISIESEAKPIPLYVPSL